MQIKSVDMSEDMQHDVVDICNAAFKQFTIEKDVAAHIKKECDRKYGGTWHAVVGRSFGSFVTHGASQPCAEPDARRNEALPVRSASCLRCLSHACSTLVIKLSCSSVRDDPPHIVHDSLYLLHSPLANEDAQGKEYSFSRSVREGESVVRASDCALAVARLLRKASCRLEAAA